MVQCECYWSKHNYNCKYKYEQDEGRQDEDLEYNSNDIIDDKEDLESIGYSSNELFE